MNEWLATVGVVWLAAAAALAAIFTASATGMGWLRRKVAAAKERRAHERHLDSLG